MFKTVSFKEVLGSELDLESGETILGIVIPRIQRDYAQGRDSASVGKVRARFLGAIRDAIVSGKELLLDFVYGDLNSRWMLMPFDGQQRLTTLFLLHWYALQKKSDRTAEEGDFLARFHYENRLSSNMFCDRLANGIYHVDIARGGLRSRSGTALTTLFLGIMIPQLTACSECLMRLTTCSRTYRICGIS